MACIWYHANCNTLQWPLHRLLDCCFRLSWLCFLLFLFLPFTLLGIVQLSGLSRLQCYVLLLCVLPTFLPWYALPCSILCLLLFLCCFPLSHVTLPLFFLL